MPDVRADAPGRVNLIGEHTDYHDGFVLPCAVPQRCVATLRTRDDLRVVARSAQLPDELFEYELGGEKRRDAWGDYVQGLTWVLAKRGLRIGGFDLHLDSDVPLGSGLSSSAAIEISTMRVLRAAFDLELSDVELARIGQRAEVEFVGAPVGIMDQMAASLAGERAALFLDTRSLAFEQIPLPPGLELVVINSGVAHQHAGGDYVTRRRESEQAAGMLGVARLRDVSLERRDEINALPRTAAKRARHVVTENARVLEARTCLIEADLERLGRLFVESHASMRDDYEITVPAVDLLVDLSCRQPGVYGARMTGGGFGGAVVLAVSAGRGVEVAATVSEQYSRQSGNAGEVLIPAS